MFHFRQRVCSGYRNHNPVLSSFMAYHRFYNTTTTISSASGADTAYLFAHMSSPLVFSVVRAVQYLVFCVVFHRSLFVPFQWPLSCLSFSDLWLVITPSFGICKIFSWLSDPFSCIYDFIQTCTWVAFITLIVSFYYRNYLWYRRTRYMVRHLAYYS